MKGFINKLIYLSLALIILIIIFGVWIFKGGHFNLEANPTEERKILLVEKGDNIKKIAEKMEVYDIYKHSLTSYILMRFLIGSNPIHIGEYEASPGDDIFNLINKIKNKQHFYRKITFVEGETITKYKEQINSAFGLVGEITEIVPEGYFMPGTYNYLYGETKNSILKRGQEDMMTFVQKLWDTQAQKPNFYLKNINEAITLASVVEKESGVGVERSLIAGVFFNRLKIGMKLQSDPTTIYEITKGRFKLDRPLTYNDLKMEGQYNTYYIKALPVGPIASPSKESLIAVFNPEETESLYFVATGNGGHNFAPDFQKHRENIRIYREALQKNK